MFTVTKKKKNWPGNREYIGTVFSGGGDINVYMPNMKDARAAGLMKTSPESIEEYSLKLSAAAVGMTLDEFEDLAYQDAAAIVTLVSAALERLKPVVSGKERQK